MKRLHIHVSVDNIEDSIVFYNAMFGCDPTVHKGDYAKWMLDDPRVNFAISSRSENKGVDHLGIQAEDANELKEIYGRMQAASSNVVEQGETVCCYSATEKSWVHDPQGIAWEAFLTKGASTVYGSGDAKGESKSACCAPSAPSLTKIGTHTLQAKDAG